MNSQLFTDKKVLIVDDDPLVCESTARILRKQGADVSYVLTGHEGLDAVEKAAFDLILLDVVLPDFDGILLCQLLKKKPALKHTGIILISGMKKDSDAIDRGLSTALADGYILRPLPNKELIARLGTFIRLMDAQKKLEQKNRENLQTEKLLQKSNERFRHMIEGAPEPIFVQVQMKFAYLNPAACRLFGVTSSAELVGTPVLERFHPDYHEKIKNRILTLKRDRKSVHTLLEQKFLRMDGSEVWVETVGEPIEYENQNGALVFARDITKRRQLEEQLQQSQKMEAMGILAGGIAHDFNNILFSILGHSEMLLEKFQKNDSTRQDIYEIYSGTLRAMDLVKQILSFSRRDKHQLEIMQIQPIVKEACKLIRSTIPATISMSRQIESDCGPVKADPTQIHQIVMNLAINAFHAMEKNGGTLTVTLKQVVWENDGMPPSEIPSEIPPGVYVCLTIADTGIGMDKSVLEKVHEPFFTTKEKGKGTGMGLSIVYGIVKNMGGTMQVFSKPGLGSSFHVYLPVAGNTSAVRPEPKVDSSIFGGTEKILLVDDEQPVITMETRLLEQLGYGVVPCTSSTEALKIFARDPNAFDLVITDLAMPAMPGDRLAKKLLEIRPDIPILLCTGFSDHLNEEKITAMGIRGFSLKPIMIRELAKKIRDILNGQHNETLQYTHH